MKTQHVIGTLTSTKREAISSTTRSRIHDAIHAAGLEDIASSEKWEEGIIIFNKAFTIPEDVDCPMDFIERLNDTLWRVGVWELGLSGEIAVSTAGNNPVVYRIIVNGSELTYQKAVHIWNDPAVVYKARKTEEI